MKVTLTNPRPMVRGDLRPVEALVLDVLIRGADEQDLPAGALGLPTPVLAEALGNLASLGYLTAEGIEATQQGFRFSEDVARMGVAKEQAERRYEQLSEMDQDAAPGRTHKPWGFVEAPLRPDQV